MACTVPAHNYHDAALESIEFGESGDNAESGEPRLVLVFSLYSVFYPEAPRLAACFGRVKNLAALRAFFAPIQAALAEEEATEEEEEKGGFRCLALHPDTRRPSSPGALRFYLAIDGFGDIRLRCESFSETLIEK